MGQPRKSCARRKWIVILAIIFSFYLVVFSAECRTRDLILPGIQEPEVLSLTSGKSIILKSPDPVSRVSIGAPEIASCILLSPQEIYITGKAAGATNLILWHDKQVSAIYDIQVEYDISCLKQKLHELLPTEKDLRVFATHDSITLSGTISSDSHLAQAMALAESYAPKGKVNNLLHGGEPDGRLGCRSHRRE